MELIIGLAIAFVLMCVIPYRPIEKKKDYHNVNQWDENQ